MKEYLMRCIFQIWKTVWMACKFSLNAPRGPSWRALCDRESGLRTPDFELHHAFLARHAVAAHYNPTKVLISARNASRCSSAQASSRGNK